MSIWAAAAKKVPGSHTRPGLWRTSDSRAAAGPPGLGGRDIKRHSESRPSGSV